MALSTGKSSYQQLIDDALFDIGDVKTAQLKDSALIVWILEAQKKICEQINVGDYYRLHTTIAQADYPFQDRPLITGASNATPIVITAAGHGLSNSDRIFIRDVQGNTNANGYFQVKSVSTTFAIQHFADISTVSNDGAGTITVTTQDEHYFATGDSVTISAVVGMTDLNATFTVTRVNSTSFTLSLTTSQTYSSGGLCLSDIAGNGAYTAGGRFWRQDEIPTMFKDFEPLERVYGTYRPRVEIREFDFIQRERKYDLDTLRTYSEYDAPACATMHESGGARVLTLYPDPVLSERINMNGYIQINTRDYYQDTVSSYIVLPQKYDEAIIFYVKMKAYERLKEQKLKFETFTMFVDAIKQLRRRNPRHIVMDVCSD